MLSHLCFFEGTGVRDSCQPGTVSTLAHPCLEWTNEMSEQNVPLVGVAKPSACGMRGGLEIGRFFGIC